MHRMMIFFAVSLGSACPAFGAPVIESDERLEVNWSTHKIRFFGEAHAGLGDEALKSAEKQAWRDGLDHVGDQIKALNSSTNSPISQNSDKLVDDARAAAKQVVQSTYSFNTTYFGDGTVRVLLENNLGRALSSSQIHFRQKETTQPATQHSGVVFEAAKAMKPRAMYQVVDETGAVLFEVKDMAQEAYQKNLMGRWFKRPTSTELSSSVGASPLHIKADVNGDRLVVRRSEWDQAMEGHQILLVNGMIAIALP